MLQMFKIILIKYDFLEINVIFLVKCFGVMGNILVLISMVYERKIFG